METLLNRGAAAIIDDKDKEGYSTMMIACCRGYISKVQILLQHGAKMDDNCIYLAADN